MENINYLAIVVDNTDSVYIEDWNDQVVKAFHKVRSHEAACDWLDKNFYQLHEKYNSDCGNYYAYIKR